ncbi:unnamed protein product, partial [Closterium sp. NIES-54]
MARSSSESANRNGGSRRVCPRAMLSHGQLVNISLLVLGVFAVLATLVPLTAARSIALTDWQALLRLREDLNFTNPQRSPKVYWRSRENCNVVFGVSCNDQGRVVTLSLWGVTGPLPDSIANLTALTSLASARLDCQPHCTHIAGLCQTRLPTSLHSHRWPLPDSIANLTALTSLASARLDCQPHCTHIA